MSGFSRALTRHAREAELAFTIHCLTPIDTRRLVHDSLPDTRPLDYHDLGMTATSGPHQRLASYTFWVLVLYSPIETWASWPELYSPYYLVDLIAMVLLTLGVLRSRQRRALPALGLLTGGWGWLGANGWRATADRFEALRAGESLEFGAAEMCFVVCGTVAAIVGLAWSLRAIAGLARDQPVHSRFTA